MTLEALAPVKTPEMAQAEMPQESAAARIELESQRLTGMRERPEEFIELDQMLLQRLRPGGRLLALPARDALQLLQKAPLGVDARGPYACSVLVAAPEESHERRQVRPVPVIALLLRASSVEGGSLLLMLKSG